MKNLIFTLTCFSFFSPIMAQIKYPKTKEIPVSQTFFDTTITENFRWLEDTYSQQTKDWVAQQNEITQNHLQSIPFRAGIEKRLKEVWNYERMGAPFSKKGKFFYFKNDGMQNQSVLYFQDSPANMPGVLLDPNMLSKDGTSALTLFSLSKDGNLAVVGISEAGSDWTSFRIFDVQKKEFRDEILHNIKFSGASWFQNGFFYSRYDGESEKLRDKGLVRKNQHMKVYYHKLGTAQKSDSLVYEDPENPQHFVSLTASDDEKILILTTSATTSGNSFYFKKADEPNAEWTPIFEGFDQDADFVTHQNGKIFIFTNAQAPNGKLIAVDLKNPKQQLTLIPESKDVLQQVHFQSGLFIASYLHNVQSDLKIFDLKGKMKASVNLPGPGIVSGINGEDGLTKAYFSFSSFLQAGTIYEMDIHSGTTQEYWKAQVSFRAEDYETKQVFYPSKDGTMIPMFITAKKGITRNGQNPVYLYGYGGFNISVTPSFSPAMIPFLEAGGIYAVANIRGGGEFGKDWYLAGTKLKKQNVFDDFIAAAEFLIAEKYSSTSKIAICGRSNGGLLVGACMTQRPDLFQVALPGVGVLDMLHYHEFTIGYAWANDYGRSDVKEEFDALIKYSPLHSIRKVKYPATLVTTADHDDRVVPGHSFKFIAELQKNQMGKNPVLIRIDVNAGHGAGKPTAKSIDEWTDIWTFTMYHLGMKPN